MTNIASNDFSNKYRVRRF